MTPPQAWVNRSPSSCGEGLEEVLGQPQERLRVALQPVVGAAAEVVDGVVAAPEDPPVVGDPVVVEEVAGVGDAVPVGPADGRALGLGERLGHQRVVPDRHDVRRQPAQQRREGVGAERHPARRQPAVRRPQHHAGAVGLEPLHRSVLVDPHAEPQAGLAQPAGQPGRVDHRDAVAVQHPAEVRRRVDLRPDLRRRPATPAVPPTCAASAGQLAQLVDLPGRGRDGELAGALEGAVDAVARRPPSSMPSRFSRPSRSRVASSSGNRSRPLRSPWVRLAEQNPPLRPDAAQPTVARLEQHDVPAGVALLGQQRGPEAGVAAADDGEVGRRRRRRARGTGRAPARPASTACGARRRGRLPPDRSREVARASGPLLLPAR